MNDNNDIITVPQINEDLRGKQKKGIRRSFSRVGFAMFGMTAFMLLVSSLFVVMMPKLDNEAIAFVRKYYLLINEAMIALSVGIGLLLLIGVPSSAPQKQPIKFKHFWALLCVGLFLATAGNLVSTTFLTFWNIFTQSQVTNPVLDVLSSISPWQSFLCTVILAPILEELFFRKFLIDKMRPHGDFLAIVVSSVFFGLFHGNFSQVLYACVLGLILGYVYCRTGSFLVVALMHMAFNFICGQLPMLFIPKVLEFYNKLFEVEAEAVVDVIVPLLMEFAVPLLCYLAFLVVRFGLDIVGIVFFCTNVKKVSLVSVESTLTKKEKAKCAMFNAGIIIALLLLIINIIASLFA